MRVRVILKYVRIYLRIVKLDGRCLELQSCNDYCQQLSINENNVVCAAGLPIKNMQQYYLRQNLYCTDEL